MQEKEEHSKWRRRRTWVDSKQQLLFCFELLLHAAIFPIMLMILLAVEPFSSWLLATNSATSRQLVVDLMSLLMQNWWVVFIALFVLGIVSVLFSHRIFGPVLRYEENLKRAMQGEKEMSFKVRGPDYFKRFAATLEKFLEHFRG